MEYTNFMLIFDGLGLCVVSDCEADGRIYQNGERLENPESPCRVCYCQSGEIVCTVIKCYTREDCMPRYVTGMCCPKYDHCPPVGE